MKWTRALVSTFLLTPKIVKIGLIFILIYVAIDVQKANAEVFRCKKPNGTFEYTESSCMDNGKVVNTMPDGAFWIKPPSQNQIPSNTIRHEGNNELDSILRRLGFQGYNHYQESKRICFNLYDLYVNSKVDSNSCGTDMRCLQQQGKRTIDFIESLRSTSQWKANRCDIVFRVESGSQSSSSGEYEIEVSHKDELFIINGEKFKAKTYCFNMEKGDRVLFIEGSALGACASATLLNMRTKDKCDVWCE